MTTRPSQTSGKFSLEFCFPHIPGFRVRRGREDENVFAFELSAVPPRPNQPSELERAQNIGYRGSEVTCFERALRTAIETNAYTSERLVITRNGGDLNIMFTIGPEGRTETFRRQMPLTSAEQALDALVALYVMEDTGNAVMQDRDGQLRASLRAILRPEQSNTQDRLGARLDGALGLDEEKRGGRKGKKGRDGNAPLRVVGGGTRRDE